MSSTRSSLYKMARILGDVEAVQHGYARGGLSGALSNEASRRVRRVIYRDGNRQINKVVKAVGLGPRHR